jgi:hypothetical protein
MGATFAQVKVWADGQTIDAAGLNAEPQNILNNFTPAGMDDESLNLSAMRAVADPYPATTESLAVSLQGELQRIRFLLAQITGKTYWYQDPDTSLAAIATGYRDYISGLTTSNATDTDHDIAVAAGCAMDSTNTCMLTLATAMTKRIDAAWAAGDANGGLFSGSVAINTWYHLFLIKKDSDGTIDAGFDTSITAANIPTGYTKYRKIISVLTNGSSNILNYDQSGKTVAWRARVKVMDDNNGANNTNCLSLNIAAAVPPAIEGVWGTVMANTGALWFFCSARTFSNGMAADQGEADSVALAGSSNTAPWSLPVLVTDQTIYVETSGNSCDVWVSGFRMR